MQERLRFIDSLESGLYTMTELCARYGISRKSGYKWADRYVHEGVDGLTDRSRAPKRCPHQMPQEVREALLTLRRKHPRWGPRKLLGYLTPRKPEWHFPAASTVGDLLRREGLVQPRRRRSKRRSPGPPCVEISGPNAVWATDFKGEFRTRDRLYCYPLTLTDRFSRYLLECRGLRSTATAGARPSMERVFRKYGLPSGIVCDNGTPFGSQALCGLSRLSVWWLKLGIEPLYIQPGHPEQNGGHERMHRTLKAETTRPPSVHLVAQQRRFNAFRKEFNEERPHEALGQQPPAKFYEPSTRPYPARLGDMEYDGHFEVRRVRRDGTIKWQGRLLFLSEVLIRERVVLEEVDDGIWSIHFGSKQLARFDERDRRLEP